ncbi:hypothetical protein TKK_0013690 [Trichogramma kaykai]
MENFFEEHQKFVNWDEFNATIAEYKSGEPKSKGYGIRNKQSAKINCPFLLRVIVPADSNFLIIRKLCMIHNHDPEVVEDNVAVQSSEINENPDDDQEKKSTDCANTLDDSEELQHTDDKSDTSVDSRCSTVKIHNESPPIPLADEGVLDSLNDLSLDKSSQESSFDELSALFNDYPPEKKVEKILTWLKIPTQTKQLILNKTFEVKFLYLKKYLSNIEDPLLAEDMNGFNILKNYFEDECLMLFNQSIKEEKQWPIAI